MFPTVIINEFSQKAVDEDEWSDVEDHFEIRHTREWH